MFYGLTFLNLEKWIFGGVANFTSYKSSGLGLYSPTFVSMLSFSLFSS